MVNSNQILIEHLKLTDVTLAVHDWGGAIGLGWAVEHPELARRFVLFNTEELESLRLTRYPGRP